VIPGITVASALVALQATASRPSPSPADYPFAVGERLEYAAKFGLLKLGEASLHVVGIDTIRGQPSFRFRFQLQGGNFLFKINTVLESWTTVTGFRSLRFRNDNTENDRQRLREYEIFPDSGFYWQKGQSEPEPTPPDPVDDAAMLYFVRSSTFEVGKTYRFENYFQQKMNPLVIKALKLETMELPDGTKVECMVLNPAIGDRGMFADRADTRLWVTTDERRLPVQIRSRYPFGTVTLKLEQVGAAAGDH